MFTGSLLQVFKKGGCMEFSEYIKIKILNYEKEVSMEELEELSKLYTQYVFWKQAEDKLLKLYRLDTTSFYYQEEWLHANHLKRELENILDRMIVQIRNKKKNTKSIGMY